MKTVGRGRFGIAKQFVASICARSPIRSVAMNIGIISFAVIGTMVFMGSHAAAPFVTAEGEAGTLTSPSIIITDSSASGGKSVSFAASVIRGCSQAKRTIIASDVSSQKNSGYPIGTLLYMPGSPDPWGGCFPGPGNTGVPAGTQLTAYTGPCTITAANTFIDARNISCSLTIQAANVQIRNSKITAGDIGVQSGSLSLVDSEVDFGNDPNTEGLKGNNFTVLRANIYGGKREVWCNNSCIVEDSYLHDQLRDPAGLTHESAVRVEQFTTLRHNTVFCNGPYVAPDAGCSADQTGYPDFTTIHDNTMDKNFYSATTGGYCAYGGNSAGKPYSNDPQNATNIVFTNNVFQRGTSANDRDTLPLTDKRRYTCGGYGVTTAFDSSRTGFAFSGNMWDDGLLFVNDTSYPYGGFY